MPKFSADYSWCPAVDISLPLAGKTPLGNNRVQVLVKWVLVH